MLELTNKITQILISILTVYFYLNILVTFFITVQTMTMTMRKQCRYYKINTKWVRPPLSYKTLEIFMSHLEGGFSAIL